MSDVLEAQLALLEKSPAYVQAMKPYTPGKPIEELKEEYGFDKVIKLASNENPFGISPMAGQAVQAAIAENFRYPDPVSRKLRRKIGKTLGVAPEEIVVGAGSESLISIAARALLHSGEEVLQGQGAFMGMKIHLSAHGGVLKEIPSPGYRFDIDALLAAVTEKTRILYLPNPNNPTGTYFTHEQLQKIVSAVPKSTLILLDEAYTEFCQDKPDYPKSLTLRQENVLILRTFSKAYGLAGFRVGYGIGHPKLIEQLTKVKMTFEPTLLGQVAAEAAWEDAAFLEKGVRNNAQELKRYYDVFGKLGLQYVESSGNFVFIEMNSTEKANALNEALLQRGLAIRPLAAFGYPSAVRITIGLPEENDALFSALNDIVPGL